MKIIYLIKILGSRLYIILAFIFIIIIFYLNIKNDTGNSYDCYIYHNFLDKDFNGVIVDKYIDRNDKSTPKINLQNGIEVDFVGLDTIYSYLEKGDSISKKPNNDFLLIKRDDAQMIKFSFGYLCDE